MFLFPPFWSFFPPCFNSSLSRAFSYQIQLQLAAHPQPLTVSIYGRMGKNACSSTDLFVWYALHFMIDEERRILFELIYLPNGGSRSAINPVFMKIAEFFAPRLLATFSAPFPWIIIHNLQFFLLYNLHFRIAFLAVWLSGTARRTSLAVSAPSWESGRVGIRGRRHGAERIPYALRYRLVCTTNVRLLLNILGAELQILNVLLWIRLWRGKSVMENIEKSGSALL